jgi:hypothetical protein
MTDLDLTNNLIDVRDIIARVEELEPVLETAIEDGVWNGDDRAAAHEELTALQAILTELETVGGGDEQWRGDWYPITLIADCYFTDYAQELAEDCGMINDNASWPNNCIDWDKAARELRIDYTPVTIGGATYWTR